MSVGTFNSLSCGLTAARSSDDMAVMSRARARAALGVPKVGPAYAPITSLGIWRTSLYPIRSTDRMRPGRVAMRGPSHATSPSVLSQK